MSVVALTVNGRRLTADVEPRTHLADFLRETHNLTGTHTGCEHGVCGACTVIVDEAPVRSCITYAVACCDAEVTTIEGLDADEIATELREAFSREHGLQCGYCTPGMIVAARDVVLRLNAPTERDIRVAMSGNLCRCTGYVGIIRAIESVVAERRARGIAAVPGGGRLRLGPAGSGNAVAMAPRPLAASVPDPGRGRDQCADIIVPSVTTPQSTLRQSFTVKHPLPEVWAFFERIPEVAACLPGAMVDSVAPDGRVVGRLRIKAGPITATFAGTADVARDDASHTGTINGSGRDNKSKSATHGQINYALKMAPGGTTVEVQIGFNLTGPLAQFGRAGLVEDVANRLTATFVHNLEGRLSGQANAPPAAELDAGSLLLAVARGWVGATWQRLFGRKRP